MHGEMITCHPAHKTDDLGPARLVSWKRIASEACEVCLWSLMQAYVVVLERLNTYKRNVCECANACMRVNLRGSVSIPLHLGAETLIV